MNNTLFRCLKGIIKNIAFAVFVFLIYELLIIPAILDWSLYGIALAILIVVLLAWSISKKVRRKWVILAITFLIAINALNNQLDTDFSSKVFGAVIIFLVLLITGKIAGRFRLRQYVTIFLVALVLTYTVDLTEIPFRSEFYVKWKSPLLYPKETSVDYFPLQAADVDKDGAVEIIVQGNLEEAEKYIIEKKKTYREPLQVERNHFLVYKWIGNGFKVMSPGSYDPKTILYNLKADYINFPYYKVNWNYTDTDGVSQVLRPQISKTQLVESAMNFGALPFESLALGLESIHSRKSGLDNLYKDLGVPFQPSPLFLDYENELRAGDLKVENLRIEGSKFYGKVNNTKFEGVTDTSAILGVGKLLPENDAAAILLGQSLQIVDIEGNEAGSVKGELTRESINDISTTEVLTADINNDGIDEVILNTEYAKILQLDKNGKWNVIWNSRDDSFRFEDFDTLGADKNKEIIALSKSVVRNARTRYITGYEFTPEGLKTKWRVFTGLINLHATDIDGDKENELIGYSYKKHRVFVLEKHDISVTQILYGVVGLLIALGMYNKIRNQKNDREGSHEKIF